MHFVDEAVRAKKRNESRTIFGKCLTRVTLSTKSGDFHPDVITNPRRWVCRHHLRRLSPAAFGHAVYPGISKRPHASYDLGRLVGLKRSNPLGVGQISAPELSLTKMKVKAGMPAKTKHSFEVLKSLP